MKVLSSLTCALALVVDVPHVVQGSAAANAALNTFKSMDYRYFVAGGTCAAISHGITCPIDVVKVTPIKIHMILANSLTNADHGVFC